MEERNNNSENKDTSLREQVEQYLRYWYWFVLAVLVAVIGAFIYLRYTPKLYLSKATIVIKDEKSSNNIIDASGLSQMGGFFSKFNSTKIENELAIFNSKRLIEATVKGLGLNIKYETVGSIKTSELYGYIPFKVQYQYLNSSGKGVPKLYFEIISASEYKVEDESQSISGTHKFGERVSLPFGDISVLPNIDQPDSFKGYIGRTIMVTYSPIDAVALNYQSRVSVGNEIKSSNVVELTLLSSVTDKSEAFLNELVVQYNNDAISDRNEVAKKTSQFIDSRINIITRELDSVERNKELFKSSNRLTDIEAEAQMILENSSESNQKQFDISTQLELSNSMIDYMENSSKIELLPSNIGIQSENVGQSVNNYNQLILYRNKLLQNSTTKNPVVVNVNNQIEQMRSNILGSLKNTSNSLKVAMKDLNIQESSLNSKLAQVPQKEKIFRSIERQQTIKEQLYLFLLQQREEASISLAATSPKAKVVDGAYSSPSPVSPKASLIYLGALLGGLIIPFLGIYGTKMLSTKVANRKDVESHLPTTSIIAEIPKIQKGESELIQDNDRSIMAEAYRIFRTNLQYLFINKLEDNNKGKSLIVTSTIKGEGKTFVAFNLALTLALTGKKVVLVGADIRNPQLQRYLPDNEKSKKGLTEFIVYEDMEMEDVISQSKYHKNLSLVLSGAIPPNPAELLMQKRTSVLIERLRDEFDFIIMDTAPSMLVTDTILINKLADITLYVVRAGYTDKRLLDFPQDAINDGRLSNVAIVLNNVELNNFGYGNKYGYAYAREERTFLQRMFNR